MNEIGKGSLLAAVRQLQEVMHRAQALGLFTEDREFLTCPSCGLWEDVTIDGLLVVYQKDDATHIDSGLRFREVDERHYVCPECETMIIIKDMDDSAIDVGPVDSDNTRK